MPVRDRRERIRIEIAVIIAGLWRRKRPSAGTDEGELWRDEQCRQAPGALKVMEVEGGLTVKPLGVAVG